MPNRYLKQLGVSDVSLLCPMRTEVRIEALVFKGIRKVGAEGALPPICSKAFRSAFRAGSTLESLPPRRKFLAHGCCLKPATVRKNRA